MKYKITVKTPKNQAEKCVESQKTQLLGWKLSKSVITSELVNDHMFYWVLQLEDDTQRQNLIERCARGEVLIKAFYHHLIKWIDRGNKLATKFKRGGNWVKRWLVSQAKKHYANNDEMLKQIENMSDDEVADFLRIDDRKQMMKLLSGKLIDIEEVTE